MDEYDATAATAYEKWVEPLTGSFAPDLLNAAVGDAPGGLQVLDCACGSGAVSLHAESIGATVTASDISPAMVARTVARSSSLETVVADVKALPADWSGRFDAVVSSFGVIFCGDLSAGLREMARCCKPGGAVAFTSWGTAAETAGFQLIPAAATSCLPSDLAAKVCPKSRRAEASAEWAREVLGTLADDMSLSDAVIDVRGPITRQLVVASPAAYWERFASTSPGLRSLLADLDAASSARLREAVMDLATEYLQSDGSVAIPVSAYVGVLRLPPPPTPPSAGVS